MKLSQALFLIAAGASVAPAVFTSAAAPASTPSAPTSASACAAPELPQRVVLDITQAEINAVMKDKRWCREVEAFTSQYRVARANIALKALQCDPKATVENVRDGVLEIVKRKVGEKARKSAEDLGVTYDSSLVIDLIGQNFFSTLLQDQKAYETYKSKHPQKGLADYLAQEQCVTQ